MMNDNVVVLLETKFEAVMTTVLTTVGGEATPEIIPAANLHYKIKMYYNYNGKWIDIVANNPEKAGPRIMEAALRASNRE